MKKVESFILYYGMPFAIRYIKENYKGLNVLKKDFAISLLDYNTKLKEKKNNVMDLRTLFEFEKEYFNIKSDVMPFGKKSSECKTFNDKVEYILFFMLTDISNSGISKQIINILKEEKKL